MHPILLKLGPLNIYAYGTFLVLAFLVANLLIYMGYKKKGLNTSFIFDLTFWVFLFGVIGARGLYVLLNLSYFSKNTAQIIKVQHGGLSWFGGLIFGIVAGIAYLKIKNIPVLETIDRIIPYVVLAQAIGRIGCFLNGCCFGKPGIWGIYSPFYQDYLMPAQLYSSLGLIIIFFILRFFQERPHKRGGILYLYFSLYGIKRFVMEYFRGDTQAAFFGLTLFQAFSLSLFILGLALLIFNQIRCRNFISR